MSITEKEKEEIVKALEEQGFYNRRDVFHHAPEFWVCSDDRYKCKIHIVKWNTRSTRITILYTRFDDKKQRWVFSKKKGVPRMAHGEKMR